MSLAVHMLFLLLNQLDKMECLQDLFVSQRIYCSNLTCDLLLRFRHPTAILQVYAARAVCITVYLTAVINRRSHRLTNSILQLEVTREYSHDICVIVGTLSSGTLEGKDVLFCPTMSRVGLKDSFNAAI